MRANHLADEREPIIFGILLSGPGQHDAKKTLNFIQALEARTDRGRLARGPE
jgi:hypothetical protein